MKVICRKRISNTTLLKFDGNLPTMRLRMVVGIIFLMCVLKFISQFHLDDHFVKNDASLQTESY